MAVHVTTRATTVNRHACKIPSSRSAL